MTKCW